jgi:hypothetical protein
VADSLNHAAVGRFDPRTTRRSFARPRCVWVLPMSRRSRFIEDVVQK